MQSKLLDEVSESRPLARLQEELEEQGDSPPATSSDAVPSESVDASTSAGQGQQNGHEGQIQTQVETSRKPLLNDDDHELDRLSRVSLNFIKSLIPSLDIQS